MATLTDAFLADLDALSDGDDQAPKEENVAKDEKAEDFIDIDSLKTDDIHVIASLSSAAKYQDTLQKVDEEVARNGDSLPEAWVGPSEADPVYRLIVACNELAMGIDDDIITTHTYIKQKYKKRFPELEGLVLDPLAYARVVERIGNEESVIDIDLEDIVPRTVQMTVSVSAATTDGQPLPAEDLKKVMEACKLAQMLDSDRAKLQRFVGSRMSLVAANLSAVCGADVAAKLVGAAGGLLPLSTMPACNIQVLGQRKRINAGLSSANVGANQGFVFLCPMVTALPPAYRRKAAKLVANKVALLARFDAYGTSSARSADEGQRMRDTMTKTIEKWMEPPPAAIIKPLAKPDAVSKKKRGGARYRKQKEKMAATEMMKQANRMEFGKAEEEYVDGDEMFGLGMLGKDGHGKLKVMQAASKITKREKLLQRAANGVTGGKGPGGAMSGTQSSLAFSHVQGIELENPNKDEEQMADVGGQRSGTESYFSELSGFKTFRKLT